MLGLLRMEISQDRDSDEFVEYLIEKGLHDDVIAKLMDNRITSAVFLDLTDEDLKELASAIGDRIALRKILEQARKVRNMERNVLLVSHYHYSVKSKQAQYPK